MSLRLESDYLYIVSMLGGYSTYMHVDIATDIMCSPLLHV